MTQQLLRFKLVYAPISPIPWETIAKEFDGRDWKVGFNTSVSPGCSNGFPPAELQKQVRITSQGCRYSVPRMKGARKLSLGDEAAKE